MLYKDNPLVNLPYLKDGNKVFFFQQIAVYKKNHLVSFRIIVHSSLYLRPNISKGSSWLKHGRIDFHGLNRWCDH